MNYFERYLAGDHLRVWSELRELGPEVHEPQISVQANLVTQEVIRRVKDNISTLVGRLNTLGYQFGKNRLGGDDLSAAPSPMGPGDAQVGLRLNRFQKAFGVLPLGICEFWKTVGWVDFSGFHGGWPENPDPLIVYPFDVVGDEEQWSKSSGQSSLKSYLPVAPDYWQKHNYSGDNWTILLGTNSVDGLLSNGDDNIYFMEYLRAYLQNGGFAGDPQAKQRPISFARELTQGLLSF